MHRSGRRKGQQMAVLREVTVPGGEGRSIEANAGEYLSIVDVEGSQVADLLVLKRDDPHTFVSSTHTRAAQRRWQLQVGDALVTQWREPLLEIVRDDVGVHDLLLPACSPAMYKQRFNLDEHASCR